MGPHEEFRELCAAATAGELTDAEQTRLSAHLAVCADCRRLKSEYESTAAAAGVGFAESALANPGEIVFETAWSVEQAEERFFKKLAEEEQYHTARSKIEHKFASGGRCSYRPSQICWRELWMPFAAAILLAIALGIAAYRSGVRRGTDSALTTTQPLRNAETSLEAQVSDAGHERERLRAMLAESSKTIEGLKRQLAEQIKMLSSLKAAAAQTASEESHRAEAQSASNSSAKQDAALSAAQAKVAELQEAVEAATAQRDANARQAALLEAKVSELTQLVRTREEAITQKDAEVARGEELLEHDRDIRELMGARELYMADVHDVSGRGTEKTYGRVFYTKGKSLIFYAFDLDAQPGFQNAKSFQAWGRRGPDKAEARRLGIFYEDNASKKRWVLKADDPKTLEDIDAVFVTLEPHGGSQHPSGKQLLFASLRISPNHP
jgi:hypothetical protein